MEGSAPFDCSGLGLFSAEQGVWLDLSLKVEICFSCGTVHLLQVKHTSKNPPGLQLEHAPAAFMSLATHLLERHHNDEKICFMSS